MRLACIADQHGTLPTIPDCDVLIIAGDITNGNPHGPRDGSDQFWWSWIHGPFAEWIPRGIPTIGIAGNHDTAIEQFGSPHIPSFHFLMDSEIVFEHKTFYGTPWVKRWDTLAFNLSEHERALKFHQIPVVDVLICHQPPFGAGDNGLGCKLLERQILVNRNPLLICGHIHEGNGIWKLGSTKVVNCSGKFTIVDL